MDEEAWALANSKSDSREWATLLTLNEHHGQARCLFDLRKCGHKVEMLLQTSGNIPKIHRLLFGFHRCDARSDVYYNVVIGRAAGVSFNFPWAFHPGRNPWLSEEDNVFVHP